MLGEQQLPWPVDESLETFFVTGKHADAVLRVNFDSSENKLDIPIHRIILSSQSRFFDAMFSKVAEAHVRFNNGDPLAILGVYPLSASEPATIKLMMEWLYLRRCEVDRSSCWYLLSLSHRLELVELESLVSNWIVENLLNSPLESSIQLFEFLWKCLDARVDSKIICGFLDFVENDFQSYENLMIDIESSKKSFRKYLIVRKFINESRWNQPLTSEKIEYLCELVQCNDWDMQELDMAIADKLMAKYILLHAKDLVILGMANNDEETKNRTVTTTNFKEFRARSRINLKDDLSRTVIEEIQNGEDEISSPENRDYLCSYKVSKYEDFEPQIDIDYAKIDGPIFNIDNDQDKLLVTQDLDELIRMNSTCSHSSVNLASQSNFRLIPNIDIVWNIDPNLPQTTTLLEKAVDVSKITEELKSRHLVPRKPLPSAPISSNTENEGSKTLKQRPGGMKQYLRPHVSTIKKENENIETEVIDEEKKSFSLKKAISKIFLNQGA